jgi:hypothetical protein
MNKVMNDDLFNQVKTEADNLRQYATDKEKSKLVAEDINGVSTKECIYGTMTGDCYSKRATTLLNKCAKPFSGDIKDFREVEDTKFKTLETFFGKRRPMYSPIEYYICHVYPKYINNLVDYIQGKTDKLIFPEKIIS